MLIEYKKDIKIVLKSLKANRFNQVEFAKNENQATKLILDIIPLDATVGIGGSVTVRQIGLLDELKKRGVKIIDYAENSNLPFEELLRQTLKSDIFLTSSNAVTLDGKLVNIDGIGNRVAGMIFGPKKVIVVIGTNKIVKDINEAMYRIKNLIAPFHAKTKGKKTPCSTTGYCINCKSQERICNVTVIIEKKPSRTHFSIILVRKDLGLGWDPNWPEERRERILMAYRESRKGFSQNVQRKRIPF